MVVSKYDTGLLSEAQVETLEKWVDTGGTLIMGTGLNWQKVYNGLPDSLKLFKINGTADFDSAFELEKFIGREVPGMLLKLTVGEKGFEYVTPDLSTVEPGKPSRFIDNDIIAGTEKIRSLSNTVRKGAIFLFSRSSLRPSLLFRGGTR